MEDELKIIPDDASQMHLVSDDGQRSHFIDGWFTTSFEDGVEPKYGYPANPIMPPAVDSIEVETIFFGHPKA